MKDTESDEKAKCFVPIVQEESGQSDLNYDGQNDGDREKMAYIPLVSIQQTEDPAAEKKEDDGEEEETNPNALTPQKMRIFTIFIMTIICVCMTGSTAFHIWNYGGDNTPLKQFKQIINRITRNEKYTYEEITEYVLSLPTVYDYENEPVENIDPDDRLPFRRAVSQDMCDSIPVNMRFDCAFDNIDSSPQSCIARGCCWKEVKKHEIPPKKSLRNSKLKDHERETGPADNSTLGIDVPFCYYPKDYSLYKFVNVQKRANGVKAILKQKHSSGMPKDVKIVAVEIIFETCSTLRIKINDFKNDRWETPVPIDRRESLLNCQGEKMYNVHLFVNEGKFNIRRGRNESRIPIFDMKNAAPLIFADQFLQISTVLPSPYLYGLGQHMQSLLLDIYWTRRVLWNKDAIPRQKTNLYGSHPFYMNLEPTGEAYGFFLLNSNAMDVKLQPTPATTFRATGGVLDMYWFFGPTPDDVIQQLTDRIGKPFLPPYWSLGYHQCRFGYNSLEETKEVWQRTRDAGIPFDVQWNDIDYMENQNDFTFDPERFKGLPEFVEELHEVGMHYMIITDPGISGGEPPGSYPPYDLGLKMDIFVKNSTGELFIGKVWNSKSTVFPDFTKPDTVLYWTQMLRDFHDKVAFDGLWIDMNEPSNFWDGQQHGCPEDDVYEHPPYLPPVSGGILSSKTMCMTAKQFLQSHYNVHNIFGVTEAMFTFAALRMTDGVPSPFIISRSTFPGSGVYGGHWTGDVESDWFNVWKSIGDILTMNIHGIPMVGADICGFNGNTTAALCNRWMQLGAFYPFSRNHNTDDGIDQDPVALGELVTRSSVKALTQRYMLLPFLYSLFFKAHVDGTPVAKPLFFNYPFDTETYNIDTQFMWGTALMIIPVLHEGDTSVMAYLPESKWYDWYTGIKVSDSGAEYKEFEAPLDTIPLLIAGGSVVPCQFPSNTTTSSRRNPFYLLVALTEDGTAEGEMYWSEEDGRAAYEDEEYTQWNFNVSSNELIITAQSYAKPSHRLFLGQIFIIGVKSEVVGVLINGGAVPFVYVAVNQTLEIKQLYLNMIDHWDIKW